MAGGGHLEHDRPHIKDRDPFIGRTAEQCRRRLPLLANNSRLLILPGCHYPNLIRRFMNLMLAQLSEDWKRRWGTRWRMAETFVDPVCSLPLEDLQEQGIALAQMGLLGD